MQLYAYNLFNRPDFEPFPCLGELCAAKLIWGISDAAFIKAVLSLRARSSMRYVLFQRVSTSSITFKGCDRLKLCSFRSIKPFWTSSKVSPRFVELLIVATTSLIEAIEGLSVFDASLTPKCIIWLRQRKWMKSKSKLESNESSSLNNLTEATLFEALSVVIAMHFISILKLFKASAMKILIVSASWGYFMCLNSSKIETSFQLLSM